MKTEVFSVVLDRKITQLQQLFDDFAALGDLVCQAAIRDNLGV